MKSNKAAMAVAKFFLNDAGKTRRLRGDARSRRLMRRLSKSWR